MNREKTWQQIVEIAYGGGPAKGYMWHDADEEAKVDEGLRHDPYDHSLLTAKAILNFNHDAELAVEYFSKALAIKPLDSHQHYNRGRKYLNLKRHAEGLADLEEAVKLDPEDNWKWHFLGVGYYLEGRLPEAVSHFHTSLEVTMRHHKDLISCEADWLWNTYMQMGEVDKAEAAVRDITPDTLVVPVIGDDEGYRDACLLLNGTMSVEDYLAGVGPQNEGGTSSGYYNLAKYHYYVEKDLQKAVEFVGMALADKSSTSWGIRLAAMDAPAWEAEYQALTSGARA